MHQYTFTCSLKSALGLIVAFQSHLCPSSFHQQLGPPWSCWTFGCWQTVALPRHCPLLCGDLETGQLFLDTQVSLAPTHVSWLVGWSVHWLVGWSHFRISNLWPVTVDQIKKLKKKQSPSIFEFCFWKDPPHPRKCI